MAGDCTIPSFNRLYFPEAFLFLETKGLTPVVFELMNDVLGKPSTTPFDDPRLAILVCMKEPKLEFSKRLRKEPTNRVANGSQPKESDNSEPDLPQTDSDDSLSTLIAPETGFDTEHFRTFNREHSEEILSIIGASDSAQGRKQHCLPEQVPVTHKRRARRKKNIRKHEVVNPPKGPHLERERQYPQQTLPGNSSTTLSRSNGLTKLFRVSRTSNSFLSFFTRKCLQKQPYQRSRYYPI
ncbi:hypothetical protein ACTXT7_000061 [Hymenolepis weldensis]